MFDRKVKVDKSNWKDFVQGQPMVGKFRKFFKANANDIIINDVYGICSKGDIKGEKPGTFITIGDIKYNSDDVKITRVTGETTNQYGFYFDLVISGIFKNKEFSFKTDSHSLHNIIFHGVENKDKKEYNKYLHDSDKTIVSTKMPYGIKKYMYNTFTTRMVLFVIKEILDSMAYKMNNIAKEGE